MEPQRGKKNIATLAALLLTVAGISFFLGAGYASKYTGDGNVGSPLFAGTVLPPQGVDFGPLWKAWQVLEDKYVPSGTSTAITSEDMVWGAVEGLAASFNDPYTVFLPPTDNAIFSDDISGNFEGVGMEIGMRNGFLTVIAPLKGTPADRAGILSGDTVIRIDGVSTDSLTIDESVKLIRGKKGTPVTLTIAREGEGEFLEIEIIRDVIDIPTINTINRTDGIFVIELYNFSAVSSNLFREGLREFVESGKNKLILDLRGNPGGFLEASVDMASWFLPAGEVILSENFGGNSEPIVHRSKGHDIFNDNLEMVILIDRGSASASEILAGALSEHGVATLVGENTFGKGSVQELVEITNDTSLKVTIARWLTPLKTTISENGLAPDIEVTMTFEDIEAALDPQFDKAVEILLSK